MQTTALAAAPAVAAPLPGEAMERLNAIEAEQAGLYPHRFDGDWRSKESHLTALDRERAELVAGLPEHYKLFRLIRADHQTMLNAAERLVARDHVLATHPEEYIRIGQSGQPRDHVEQQRLLDLNLIAATAAVLATQHKQLLALIDAETRKTLAEGRVSDATS